MVTVLLNATADNVQLLTLPAVWVDKVISHAHQQLLMMLLQRADCPAQPVSVASSSRQRL